MKLHFKQRFFSWLDSYDIYYEDGSVAFQVEGKLSWGHKFHILSSSGEHLATVKQRPISFLPKFDMYIGDNLIGTIKKQFTFINHAYSVDSFGWEVKGDFLAWSYEITDSTSNVIATLTKEFWNFTDTYTIEVFDPKDALNVLLVNVAIDAAMCQD